MVPKSVELQKSWQQAKYLSSSYQRKLRVDRLQVAYEKRDAKETDNAAKYNDMRDTNKNASLDFYKYYQIMQCIIQIRNNLTYHCCQFRSLVHAVNPR